MIRFFLLPLAKIDLIQPIERIMLYGGGMLLYFAVYLLFIDGFYMFLLLEKCLGEFV